MSDRRRYTLGPAHGQLTVLTGTAGPAARAGHDLTIVVSSWEATLIVADPAAESRLTLSVDPGSLVVLEGRGGASPLGPEDKAGITATIRDEILGQAPVRFESTGFTGDHGELTVTGTLELHGVSQPITFVAALSEDGRLVARTTLCQTDFGMKPYSVLFGTLRVADEVSISAEIALPDPDILPGVTDRAV